MNDNEKVALARDVELSVPKWGLRDYLRMPESEFAGLCDVLSADNRKWFKEYALNAKTSWMYVSPRGEIWGYGEGDFRPTTEQTRESAQFRGIRRPLFLLSRPTGEYCDTSFFLPTERVLDVAEIFGRETEEFKDYRGLDAGISTINAQSGLVNNLIKHRFAIGALGVHKPLMPGQTDKKKGYTIGGVYANVTNINWASSCSILHLGIQNKIEVHKRGGTVTGEREGEKGRIRRIELLNRINSDPIVNIFDTWKIKSRGWNSLILHGNREEYNAIDESADEARQFDWFPLHAPYNPAESA